MLMFSSSVKAMVLVDPRWWWRCIGGFKVLQDLSVLTQVYPVTVGLGGNRGTQNNESGSKGGNSVSILSNSRG